MKIIFVTTESFIDHSYTIARELKTKIDLNIYIIAKESSPEIAAFCSKLGAVYIKRLRFRNALNLIYELRFLNTLRKQENSLVWFNTLSVFQALFLKFFVTDFLVTMHDAERHPEEKDFHGTCARWLTFKFYKKQICLVSKTQGRVFESRFGIKPRLFQLPVIDYYEVSAANGPGFRNSSIKTGSKSFSSGSEPVKFFFFGTILPYKGIEILLDAAGILLNAGVEYRLNVYGSIKYNEKKIIERIKNLDYILLRNEYIPYDEVFSLFGLNDMTILPYIQTTQCGPLLIAYNQNIPVICSDLRGFAEYVDDGRSGLLFGGTAEELAEKMKMVTENPSMISGMKKYIAESIKKRFSMSALGPVYISNFKDKIEKGNRYLS